MGTANSLEQPTNDLRRAWRMSGVTVLTDTWIKMSMKRKERWPEGKYIVKKPEQPKDTTPLKKPRVPLFEESQNTKPAQESQSLQQQESDNPFIIEDIDIHPDIEEATTCFRPLSISPIANEKRRPSASKLQPTSLSTTPSKSKFMTLKSPAKKSPSQPLLPVVPPSLFDKEGSHHSGSLLQNNLTEILRRAKQQENKPPTRRPPRKFQGRANSTSEESGGLGGNSLSRNNSLQSNQAEGQDSVETTTTTTTTTSKYKYNLTSLSRANSLSNNLDFGESMIYDSNPESGPRNLQLDPDSQQQPLSQVVHYVDAEAEVERKKLFEKLKMVDDGGVLKGRLVVKSTVAAQEVGGPIARVGRARKV